jgi:hypothetical protein
MLMLGGFLGLGGTAICCVLFFAVLMAAGFIYYWRHQANMSVSATPPQPHIQATIAHPTTAEQPSPTPAEPVPAAPAPAAAEPTAPAPAEPAPTAPPVPPTPSSDPGAHD